MNRNRKILVFSLVLIVPIITLILFTLYPFHNLTDTILKQYYYETFESKDEPWLARIDKKYHISKRNVERDKNILIKWLGWKSNLPTGMTKEQIDALFLNNVFNQNLVIMEAIEEGLLDDKEFNDYIWISIKEAIAQYYLRSKISKEINQDKLSNENAAIAKIFSKNKKIYESLGLSKEQSIKMIRQSLRNELFQKNFKKAETDILNKIKLKHSIEFSK